MKSLIWKVPNPAMDFIRALSLQLPIYRNEIVLILFLQTTCHQNSFLSSLIIFWLSIYDRSCSFSYIFLCEIISIIILYNCLLSVSLTKHLFCLALFWGYTGIGWQKEREGMTSGYHVQACSSRMVQNKRKIQNRENFTVAFILYFGYIWDNSSLLSCKKQK